MLKHALISKIGLFYTLIGFIVVKLLFATFLKDATDEEAQNGSYVFVYTLMDFFIIILIVISIFQYGNSKFLSKFLILSLLIMIPRLFTDYYYGAGIVESISSCLKLLSPIWVFLTAKSLYISAKRIKHTLIGITLIVLTLSVFAFFFFPPSTNRGDNNVYWPVYFSGLHTQAYVLLAVFMFLFLFFLSEKGKLSLVVLGFAIFYVLFFGYNVRTSLLSFITFISILGMHLIKNKQSKYYISLIVPLLGIILLFVILVSLDVDWVTFSSGRLSMYGTKYDEIVSRGFWSSIFGTGSGSDLIVSDIWWWDKKGSHNDYLTFLIEGGVIFLLSVILLLIQLFKSVRSPYSYCILCAYCISSLISNGYLLRPLPAYILMLTVVWSEQYYLENILRNIWKKKKKTLSYA